MNTTVLTVDIRFEPDIVLARQRARQIAALLRFERQDQIRIATAVSELARNAFQYAKGGRVEFQMTRKAEPLFQIKVTDRGPGISNIKEILDGKYISSTGMGLGLAGVRRLMDSFEIDAPPGRGTTAIVGKRLPKPDMISGKFIASISDELAKQAPQSPFEEVQRQNQELIATLEEGRSLRTGLEQVNRELEETNRGVVALYAELDEKAESLRRASEVKSRFLSNITHELRTPLNAIVSLARMLLESSEGPLNEEQTKQIKYIIHSANNLCEMVNDLLDLAKVEAGKVTVRPQPVQIAELFSAIRGMLRPLASTYRGVMLVFDDLGQSEELVTDDTKLAQILRNFISNALKYTEAGEIRVCARSEKPGWITFSVKDTGIGIAPEHRLMIFEEFVQLETPHQKKFKGTGLGLPLCKALAKLLGGHLNLESEVGVGSTFSVTIPVKFTPQTEPAPDPQLPLGAKPPVEEKRRPSVLIIDDEAGARAMLKNMLPKDGLELLEAADGEEGILTAQKHLPEAIFLDLAMPGLDGFSVLERLEADEKTKDLRVIVHTSRNLNESERALLQKRGATVLKKTATRMELQEALQAVGIGTGEKDN